MQYTIITVTFLPGQNKAQALLQFSYKNVNQQWISVIDFSQPQFAGVAYTLDSMQNNAAVQTQYQSDIQIGINRINNPPAPNM